MKIKTTVNSFHCEEIKPRIHLRNIFLYFHSKNKQFKRHSCQYRTKELLLKNDFIFYFHSKKTQETFLLFEHEHWNRYMSIGQGCLTKASCWVRVPTHDPVHQLSPLCPSWHLKCLCVHLYDMILVLSTRLPTIRLIWRNWKLRE